jgi:ribose/xylose/arabinose/galactoside ABC-type transport system permease subunit
MNLTGVESYTQKVIFGLIILLAVLLDMLKTHGWYLDEIGGLMRRLRPSHAEK